MEKKERIKYTIHVFSCLMRKTVFPEFVFPGGGIAGRCVSSCLDVLANPCDERIIDYCICQVHAISRFSVDYLRKWNVSHSFGKKALKRFNEENWKYSEDAWLKRYGFSRNGLLGILSGNREHPLHKFIFPEYEENTKRRMLNTEVGFYICLVSTLLFTPFSPVCRKCNNKEKCREATKEKYPELFRIRIEAYKHE
jgi:hypothetical protein